VPTAFVPGAAHDYGVTLFSPFDPIAVGYLDGVFGTDTRNVFRTRA
jgi:hypothetical protein